MHQGPLSRRAVATWALSILLLTPLAGCAKSSPAPTTAPTGAPAPSAAPLEQGVTKDSISLGMVNDLTGPQSAVGNVYYKAFTLYFKELNAKGGINGRQIKIVSEDGRYNTAQEISLYKKLTTETKVFDVITTFSTPAQQALDRQYTSDKNVVFPLSKDDYSYEPAHPWIFTTSPTYGTAYRAEVDYVAAKNPNAKVAVVYPNTLFGQNGLKTIEDRAKEKKVNITAKAVLEFGAVDASSQVETIKSAGVDYVLLVQASSSTAVFLQAADRLGLKAQAAVLGNFNPTDVTMLRVAGPASKGFIGVAFYELPADNPPGMKTIVDAAQRSNIAVEEATSNWFVAGWVDAMVVAEGLKRAGDSPSRDKFRNAVEALSNFDTGGLTYPLTYSKDAHVGTHRVRYVTPTDDFKGFKAVSDWVEVKY